MIKLKIAGMTCQHCVRSVTEAVAKVPGVQEVVAVDLARQEALISGQAETDALVDAVQKAGYQAQVAA